MLLAEARSEPQLYQYLGVLFLALVAVAFAVGTMFASKLAGWFFNTRRAKASTGAAAGSHLGRERSKSLLLDEASRLLRGFRVLADAELHLRRGVRRV